MARRKAKSVARVRCPVGSIPTATVKIKRAWKGKRTYIVKLGRCVPVKCGCKH